MRTYALVLALIAGPAQAWSGQVIGITDGDTMTVLRDRVPVKIRIHAIDAPESRQPFGTQSRQSLASICFHVTAEVEHVSTDRYGRTVGVVSCSGIDVASYQVSHGYAWVFPRYAPRNSPLYGLQDEARSARRGLWLDRVPVAPWTWRKQS